MSLRNKKLIGIFFALLLTSFTIFAQEALKSTAEEYYDFLALQGLVDRPTLNYRTLSDSVWVVKDESGNIWSGNNLGTTQTIGDRIKFRVYGPDLFSSFNSSAPYGQNDGALWQGKGLNSSLTGGARFEGYGFALTLKPQVTFSQNENYDYITPAYSGSLYEGKAATYGYYGVNFIDAPQRFGDSAFWNCSWGDSEIRYSWKSITAGFGTQSIWLGPAKINPILHSNNAAPYPKLDIGLRKQAVTIPWLGYAGDIETRLWTGYLSESGYFDNDTSNDHNLISGLAFSYSPSFFSGLTLSANRVYLSKWEGKSVMTIPSLFFVKAGGKGDDDVWDQRASFAFSWLFPKSGFEVYGELGVNDWVVGELGILRYPFHSAVYTGGLRKSFETPFQDVHGELMFELTCLEMTQDFQFQWASTFYAHHQITQGYTNEGQWLGAGIGTGGNSQYLGCKLYYPKGTSTISFYRVNPDNDYLYAKTVQSVLNDPNDTTASGTSMYFFRFKATFATTLESTYFIKPDLEISGSIAHVLIMNPQYEFKSVFHSVLQNNWRCAFGLKKYF